MFINLLEAHSPYQDVPQADRFGAKDIQQIGQRAHLVQEAGPEAVPDFPRQGEVEQARLLHAAGIRADDDLVGQLLAGLDRRNRTDQTDLVVTADHGESMGEHGYYGHMIGLHSQNLHVPLVVVAPNRPPARVDTPVSTRRIHPTILSLAGLPPGASAPLPLAGQADPPGQAPQSEQFRPLQVLADRRRDGVTPDLGPLDSRAARARDDRWAVLAEAPTNGGPIRWSLYDLQADPVEAHDLQADLEAGRLPPEAAQAVSALHTRVQALLGKVEVAAGQAPPVQAVDSDLRAQLQALGYMAGD